MKKYFLFILSFLLFESFVQSQSPNRQLTKREQEIARIDYQLEASTILDKLQKLGLKMQKSFKTNENLEASVYSVGYFKVKKWTSYRWLIADTGLSRKWLKNVGKLLYYMHTTQLVISNEKAHDKQTAKYKQAQYYLKVAYERYIKLIKKPVKVSSKLQRKAKLQKALWQKAMRKKYKIDKKAEADFL